MIEFSIEIMRLDGGRELDFFDPIAGLVTGGFFSSLGFLVKKLSVIHDATDGGCGVRGDLDEIEVFIAGKAKCGIEGHDPELFLGIVNDPDFAGANFPISAMERFAGRKRSSKRATQRSLTGWNSFIRKIITELAGGCNL